MKGMTPRTRELEGSLFAESFPVMGAPQHRRASDRLRREVHDVPPRFSRVRWSA